MKPIRVGFSRWRLVGVVLVAMVIGVGVGVILSFNCLYRTLWVDFTSGAVKEQIWLGPYMVWEEYQDSAFAMLPDVRTQTSASHAPDFQLALDFRAGRRMSTADYEAGWVLVTMTEIGHAAPIIGMPEAARLKAELLDQLQGPSPFEACHAIRQLVLRELDKADGKPHIPKAHSTTQPTHSKGTTYNAPTRP